MLSKLKPVPRMLLILAVVGGGVFAASYVDWKKLMPAKPAEVAVEATPVPAATGTVTAAEPAPAPTYQAPPPQQAAAPAPAPAPAPQQDPANDAGLAAVLGAGKKK